MRVPDAGGQRPIHPGGQLQSAGCRLGLALGGLPGVLIAALIVKSLPLTAVRWLVVVAVIYAAFTMLRSAMRLPGIRRLLPLRFASAEQAEAKLY